MTVMWIRLDVSLPSNPKVLALLAEADGHRSAFVYVCALAYCGMHGTDGFISTEALPHVHAELGDAHRLAKVHLWTEQPGGWLVHDWASYQQSTEETQQRKRRGQAAAQARWAGHETKGKAQREREYRERKKKRGNASW